MGGGFGGVRTALDLSRLLRNRGSSIPSESGAKKFGREHQIALIDKNNYQTFQPALYEVASIYGVDHEHPYHTKLRGTICIPYREIFEGTGVELIQAEISHIDFQAKHVVTHNGDTIRFDYLVLAFGSVTSTFGIPGVEEYAFKFKTIEDGLMLNDKIEQTYIEAGQKNRTLPVNILIGGAGFNGVELAAELSNCSVHIAHRHGITAQSCTAITLLEAGPTILPMISENERKLIERRLKSIGINIKVNSVIEEVGPDFVKLKGGDTMKGDLIVWSGGVKALDMLKAVVGLELDDHGRILVNDFLQIKNHGDIFAVGDNIVFSDPINQKSVPQLSYPAIEQGRIAAKNILRLVNDTQTTHLEKYKPGYNKWIAPIGGKFAVAHLGRGIDIGGFLGWIIREVADLRYFLTVLPFLKAIKLFFDDIRVFSKND